MKLMTKDRSMCSWSYFITFLMFKSSLIVKESIVEKNDSLRLTVLMTLRTSRITIKTLRWTFLQSFHFFVMSCSLSSSDEILNEVKLSVLSTALLKHCMKFSCSLFFTFFYSLNLKDVVKYSLLCHICQCNMKVDCISNLNFFKVLDFIDNFLLFKVEHYLANKLSLIIIKIDVLQSEIALLFIHYKKLWMMNHLIIHRIIRSQDHAIKVNHCR